MIGFRMESPEALRGRVPTTLAALRASPKSASAKVKFILATDGVDFEAEDLTGGETVACAFKDYPDHFGFFLPLAGNEVVVAFLNGDPDRPIIVGNVYNAANLPPRVLPDDPFKTIVQDVAGNFIAFDAEEDSESFTIRTAYNDQFTTMGDCSEPD
jgi:hypothetical protein